LWVAERMVLLDHLTRGRTMLGCGPGSLPTDSMMLGLNPTDTRELMDVDLDIIMRLLRGETVTEQTRTHTLVDARLHLRPYTEPCFDIAVAAVASPTGPRLAGRHGVGLLSIGATLTADGFDALAHHWNVVEERAAHHGQTVSRRDWRLVGLMHIAETREQAYRDVQFGIETWFRYFQKTAAFPQMAVEGGDVKEMIDFINEAGVGAIGTVEDARAQVQRLWDQSNGGFGAMLLLAHEWANPQATKRSYELIAQHVMPHFQGGQVTHAGATLDAKARATGKREDYAAQQLQAVATMTERYQQERAAKG
jgi:limonene 1,2-monooxygenase